MLSLYSSPTVSTEKDLETMANSIKNKEISIPSAHMVVLRKDFAWKDTRSSWRNANSRLRQKIYEEWRRRRARENRGTQRGWISQAQKRCQLSDSVFTKVKKEGITGRGGRHWSALDTVTHNSTTRKGNCWQYPAKYFVGGESFDLQTLNVPASPGKPSSSCGRTPQTLLACWH